MCSSSTAHTRPPKRTSATAAVKRLLHRTCTASLAARRTSSRERLLHVVPSMGPATGRCQACERGHVAGRSLGNGFAQLDGPADSPKTFQPLHTSHRTSVGAARPLGPGIIVAPPPSGALSGRLHRRGSCAPGGLAAAPAGAVNEVRWPQRASPHRGIPDRAEPQTAFT